MHRTRRFALLAIAAFLLGSCTYADMATTAQDRGDPLPWWCNPTEEIPVTEGPAAGTVDWYAGTHKQPLTWDQCHELSAWFDQARTWALQWPTAAAAEADGWSRITPFIPGMGTHHVRGGVTPAMLADPSFDRFNPILDAVGLDGVFDPTRPDVLQYDGNGPTAKLVGFDYYVRTSTGLPPEGFPGNNDWWHHHPWICHSTTTAAQIGFNVSDSRCASLGGVNVNLSNYYMLHVWLIEDMVYTPDVYAGMIPCIGSPTIHDPQDPCHTSRSGGMGTMAHEQTIIDPESSAATTGSTQDGSVSATAAHHHGG